jgi:hypothetical protein
LKLSLVCINRSFSTSPFRFIFLSFKLHKTKITSIERRAREGALSVRVRVEKKREEREEERRVLGLGSRKREKSERRSAEC